MTLQAAQFIDALALQGESLELTLEAMQNEKGRLLPLRSKSMLATSPMAENPEIRRVLEMAIRNCPHGAWVSLNPIRKQIAGKAPGDADVTSFRYTLIEADELTKEEPWEKIRRLNLPVKSVVW